MIDETIVLLTPFEYCSEHSVARHISYLRFRVPFDECFYQPLQKIFSKVVLYDYLKRMVEIGVTNMNQEVIELVREEHPKYVLWSAWGEYYEVRESTFAIIRKEGTPVVVWFFDDEVRFDYYSKWWVPYVDYIVTNAMEAVPKYKELGAWVTHAVPDTGSAVERDWSSVEEKYEVSFVGSIRADREQYINVLKDRNIPIHLFGTAWGRFVSYEEMTDIFVSSKINLNFSKTYSGMKFGIKGRVFKVCLAGGFLLTEYVPGIERYFEIGKEIVCFHNPEEMIDKITYYLNHDEERRAIAQAGWKRATTEYTSFHIVSRVFQEIERGLAAGGRESNSHPQELRMPRWIRKLHSRYYFQWGRAFLMENCNGLWKDALALSISYNPFNMSALYFYIAGFFPSSIRITLVRLYTAMAKLYGALLHGLGYIPYTKKIYQKLIERGLY